jgi:methylated-DNA-[protein]-cysteine S-methyltransferase
MHEPGTPAPRPRYCLFDTAIGVIGLAWSGLGLTRLQLPEAEARATERRLRAHLGQADAEDPPAPIRQAIADLKRYCTGARADFATVVLDLSGASPFERKVCEAARGVGWGETASYGWLARQIAAPGAARAVGQALARNRVAIIIPCHRILASGKGIGGFSAFGGARAKARLLALENVNLGEEAPLLPGLLPQRC